MQHQAEEHPDYEYLGTRYLYPNPQHCPACFQRFNTILYQNIPVQYIQLQLGSRVYRIELLKDLIFGHLVHHIVPQPWLLQDVIRVYQSLSTVTPTALPPSNFLLNHNEVQDNQDQGSDTN